MFDYGNELDRADVHPAEKFEECLVIKGALMGEAYPCLWRQGDSLIPGYISGKSAIMFTRNKIQRSQGALRESEKAVEACCYSK
jgi:hypothetical protein